MALGAGQGDDRGPAAVLIMIIIVISILIICVYALMIIIKIIIKLIGVPRRGVGALLDEGGHHLHAPDGGGHGEGREAAACGARTARFRLTILYHVMFIFCMLPHTCIHKHVHVHGTYVRTYIHTYIRTSTCGSLCGSRL